MKHAVILGHPSGHSFNAAIAQRYIDTAHALGHETVFRDLYEIQYEPRLSHGEMPKAGGFAPCADVVRERAFIGDADVFAFVYPLWFNTPPAIVSGYIQRVFGMGFGFTPRQHGGNQPLLTGRRLITITTSGAPTQWLVREGAWEALNTLFDSHLADMCGLETAEHLHFGPVTSGMRTDVAEEYLHCTEDAVRRLVRMNPGAAA